MKKILVFLFVLAMMLSIVAVPVSAAENKILMGTPTIDGQLDDIYKQSYSATVDTSTVLWVPLASEDDISATVYFLHDGTYIYVAAQVTGDSAVVDTGLKSWVADSVEVYFSDSFDAYAKIPLTAFANPITSAAVNNDENKLGVSLSDIVLAATQYEGGYTVEAKLLIPYYDSNNNSIGINLQLNNFYSADTNSSNVSNSLGGAYGQQAHNSDPVIVSLSNDAVSGESSAPESSAPESSAPESSAPESSAPESSKPESSKPSADTGHGTLISGAIILFAAAATVVVASKKR